MRLSRAILPLLAGLFALPGRSASGAPDLWLNPGTMGPNALPTQPGESTSGDPSLVLRLEATAQLTGAGDRSFVPAFRLEAPFGRWATMISEGKIVELWSVTADTAERWSLARRSGVTGGDLSFGAKFLFFDGGRRFPSIGARQLTKTTTGKGLYDRRFTNAPAYLLDLLLSQHLAQSGGVGLEAWGNIGFYAWQQGRNGQNDCVNWSATVAARFPGGSLLRADLRGYSGWQAYDEPLVAGLGGEFVLSRHLAVSAFFNAGFRDAPLFEGRLGLVLRASAVIPFAVDDPVESGSGPQPDSTLPR